MASNQSEPKLKRSMSTSLLAVYGMGTILGAGIFVLIGKIIGTAGYWTPLAFFFAGLIAAINGMVYAELSTRNPEAGGPSSYVQKAFGKAWLSTLIGWMIVITGVVSCATITTGFSGYLTYFIDIPEWIVRLALLIILGGIALAGTEESAWFMAITTSMGVIGLGMVIYAGFVSPETLTWGAYKQVLPSISQWTIWIGLISATFLAIYSFIGFEDMVHMAEEVKNPATAMPTAIAFAIGAAAILYIIVALAALMVLEPAALANSKAPLIDVIDKVGMPTWPLAILSLGIILNGALAQIIMATRVIYGMRKTQGAPQFLTQLNPRTKTPIIATILSTLVALLLALFFPLKTLASITSLVMLLIFVASNAALIVLEKREPEAPFDTPIFLPWIGLFVSILLVIANFFVSGGGH